MTNTHPTGDGKRWRLAPATIIGLLNKRRWSTIPCLAHTIFPGPCQRIGLLALTFRSASNQPNARLVDYLSPQRPRFRARKLRLVFAKRGVSCSFLRQIAVNLCAKRASFAAFKKVISFVFSNFLALFPLFLYSLAVPRVSPSRAISVPATSPTLQSPARTCAMSKSSNFGSISLI